MKRKCVIAMVLLAIATIGAYAADLKVTTDTRFARGATMAFGRMTVAGVATSQISEQGFCYSSENAEPTIDDLTTTTFLNNNGRIYWLKELAPATKYYMRAFVKTRAGETGYGDVISFYTLPKGTMTFGIRDGGDAAARERIRQAADKAVDLWNNLTNIQGVYFNVGHNPGTPTADCSYGGYIRVGDNQSYQRTGTLLHEMLHGVGVGTNTIWWDGNMRSNGDRGYWQGDRATEVLRFWDNNATEQLNGDNTHMWPYGINGAHEDNGTDLLYLGNSLICQALMEDGLQPSSSHFANPYYALDITENTKYYLKNENEERGFYTSYLTENADGTLSWKDIALDELATTDEAAWYITFTPANQYYQFRNAATGHYLSISGANARTATALSANTDIHMMKARVDAIDTQTDAPNPRGYWLLHHAARNPRALSAAANGTAATEVFNLANTATAQRWLVLSAEQARDFDQVGMGAFRSQVAEIIAQLKSLRDVPHTEDTEGTDATLNAIITEIEAASASATNAIEVAQLVEKARQAEFDFLANATPTDIEQPFNVSLLIQNADLNATDGWTGAPTLNYSCAEFYEKAFDFNQTLENMPAGTYILKAQAFMRPGYLETAYRYYQNNSTTRLSTYLYAGSNSVRVHNICDDAQTAPFGVGNESQVGDPAIYVPNDMHSTSEYFSRGLYDNEVATEVKTDGSSLKIGIRNKTANEYYWSIFDNFRLYYYGSKSIDEVTGIEDVQGSRFKVQGSDDAIYDLSGRRLSTYSGQPTALPKGIYIVGGKKVVVK